MVRYYRVIISKEFISCSYERFIFYSGSFECTIKNSNYSQGQALLQV